MSGCSQRAAALQDTSARSKHMHCYCRAHLCHREGRHDFGYVSVTSVTADQIQLPECSESRQNNESAASRA